MKIKKIILFTMKAVLLTVTVSSLSHVRAEAGKEPTARTILLWADGARMDTSRSGPCDPLYGKRRH